MGANNNKPTERKSTTMSADDLKEMITDAVKACLNNKADNEVMEPASDAPAEGMDVMDVIEQAVEAATEKRKARKEAGEDVGEDLTADDVLAEAAAILDEAAAADATKEEGEAEDTEAKGVSGKTEVKAGARKAAPAQRKYANVFMSRKDARESKQKKAVPPKVQLARAVKCLDVFGRHDPEAAAYYAKKAYDDEAMAKEFKAMSVTNPSSGGYLVPEIYMDEVIELLYAKTVVFELGARRVPMPNGNLNIPKMTSGARATWGGEARKIAKSQPTFGNIKLSSKRLEAIVPQTRELLMSTDYSADALFADDLTRRMYLGIDYGALFGIGGDFQPIGVASHRDVEKVDVTKVDNTSLVVDGKITADFPVWLVSKVMSKNVDDLGLGWTFNSFVEGLFKNMKTEIGDYIYRDEMNTGKLLGFPYKVSNQIMTSADNKTTLVFGNWADLLVGEQMGLETYTTLDGSWTDENGVQHNAFEENLSATRALMYVDIAPRHAESFIVVNNIAIA